MRIVARQDIEAPIATVFERLTDFRSFERSAIRRGASVQRRDALTEPGKGMAWEVSFTLRGKRRDMILEIEKYDPAEGLDLAVRSPGMSGQVLIQVVALSPSSTRLRVETEIKPQTLSARLLLQSLRLARSNLQERLRARMKEFAAMVEGRKGPRRT